MKYKNEEVLTINGQHDSSVTFIDKFGKLRTFEFERYVKKRYAAIGTMYEYNRDSVTQEQRIGFLELVKDNLFCKNIKLILYVKLDPNDILLLSTFFPGAEYQEMPHHLSHAYTGLYNSGFDDCLIFSVDGGGLDYGSWKCTKVYLYRNNQMLPIWENDANYGYGYQRVAYPLKELPYIDRHDMSTSGKLMGLSAYGKIVKKWIDPFREYFHNFIGYLDDSDAEKLFKDIGFDYIPDSISGQTSYDIARTCQHVLEMEIFNIVIDFVNKYDTNVIMVGGVALNVLANQKIYEYLKEKNLKMYVPPAPSDCGLTIGMYYIQFPDFPQDEICFSGMQILDGDKFIDKNNTSEDLTIKRVVEYLSQGKIIGILGGNSEVGPRALGNRSIICYPSFPEMKDTLNSKVKFREWFRPFAPVCKVEEKDLFFENATPSKYMSYAPTVKAEYKNKLSSITHVDNTARLQTVEEGCMFYDILSEMTNQDLIPVILNTSFNIKGKPILTRVEDAFYVLNNTEMDYLIYNNKIYGK